MRLRCLLHAGWATNPLDWWPAHSYTSSYKERSLHLHIGDSRCEIK